ncbi:MAG: formyltetrahydrofolate deformylase [Holosporales bacterium]
MSAPLILTLSCVDKIGIVAAVSGFLARQGCNILESAQYFDPATRLFFLRTVFANERGSSLVELDNAFAPIKAEFAMSAAFHDTAAPLRALLFVSKFDHCLQELLYQQRAGSLKIHVAGIVSNHPDAEPLADFYRIPYHYLPLSPGAGGKAEQEQKIWQLIEGERADLVVLARYMQIFSDTLCAKLPGRAINIHHSFLPSFKGAKPYHQAHQRGVKIMGATAHYITAELDEGPIIEQEITRINHAHTPEEMMEMGRSLESLVLFRAVKYHAEHRVVLNGAKTVVFR